MTSAQVQIGDPGPGQKASAILLTDAGRPFAVAKFALGRRADAALETEAGWLRTVGELEGFERQVPQVLEEGTIDGGHRYLVTSAAPSTATTEEFTPGHARFLAALREVRMRVSDFEMSARARDLQQGLAQLGPQVDEATRAQLERAISECEGPLLYWSGPYVASQGDFAPWNIRMHGDGIFVFDWEAGREGVSPLDDVLHYQLAGRAMRGRPAGPRQFARAIARARQFAAETYPQWQWTPRIASALSLAYLLGEVLRHSVPARRIDLGNPVVECYWRLIEQREQWSAE
jgi:hypothetical protein